MIQHQEKSNPMLSVVFSVTIPRQALMRLLKYPFSLIFMLTSRSFLSQKPTTSRSYADHIPVICRRGQQKEAFSMTESGIEVFEIMGGRIICKIITLYIDTEDFVAFHGTPFSLLYHKTFLAILRAFILILL